MALGTFSRWYSLCLESSLTSAECKNALLLRWCEVRELPSNNPLPPGKGATSYSVLGSISVVLGLSAAIASAPDDPRPLGAMFWPALYLTIGLLAVPVLRVRRNLTSIIQTEHFLMLALVYWLILDMLQSEYPLVNVTYDSVIMAMMAIGAMAIGIWLGSAGKGWRPPGVILRAAQSSMDDFKLVTAICISFFLGMFYFAWSSGFDLPVMIEGLGRSRFAAPWSCGRSGDWSAFIEHMTYFGYFLPSLTVLLAHRRGWLQARVVFSAVVSVIMLLFLMQSGGRRIVGVVIGAAFLSWLLMQERLRPRLLIGVAFVLILLLAVMNTMLEYRQVGLAGWLHGDYLRERYSALHVDDNFLRLSQITEIFPETVPYVGLRSLVYVLVRPIPRALWPGKPSDPGYDLPTLVGLKGSAGTSLSYSIVGELYVINGLLAVLLGGLLFGRLSGMCNKIIDMPGDTGKPLVCGLAIMTLFASIRSMQDLVILSYALLAWLIISRVLSRRREANRVVRAKSSPTLRASRVDAE